MRFYCYTITILILFSCNASIQEKFSAASKGHIVITIGEVDVNNRFDFASGLSLTNETLFKIYADNALQLSNYSIKEITEQQKISISLEKEYAILRHQINAVDYFDYLIKKGDTLELTYVNRLPVLKLKNRITKSKDTNIEEYINKEINKEPYITPCKYFDNTYSYLEKIYSDKTLLASVTGLSVEKTMTRKFEIDNLIKKDLYPASKKYSQNFTKILDSLYKAEDISEDVYNCFKNKYTTFNKIIDIENGLISESELKQIIYSGKKVEVYYDLFHQQLIESIVRKYIIPKTKFLDLKNGVNKDNREIYKLIKESNIFSEEDKQALLAKELSNIGHNFPKGEFINYYNDFSKYSKDSTLISSVKNSFYSYFDTDTNISNSVILSNNINSKVDLNKLLISQKSKIVYIDFWASWCAPCRKEFRHSLKLRNEFKSSPITFLYISIDKDKLSWEKASFKEQLDENNFLFVNYENSVFSQLHKLSLIPRYMIFDNKGNLIYGNAPPPSDPKIREIFDKMLKK
ncbi:TlpA disulfide reductase family protein [Emticicia sp. 21SJ11W-3]|uniref:TlpA family protein disulfide reductase n=1 Tax=Emticicia sp. 21SJ11W-3 TaxID=2916755 RepID=UPI00209F9B68|nr:TlpA disulfide reductase family protein [Emticicia sp. 21SJ11W-3]UTA68695.1 TlpA family protein disulfide reductase [Emticicia sp. 21SJ11W-3]